MDRDSDLLAPDRASALTAAARTGLGDRLRSLTYFTPESFEQVYLRSDLEADADLSGFVELARNGFQTSAAYAGSELGSYAYTVRMFDHGSLVRVTDGDEGVFVTAETLTIRRSEEIATALDETLTESATDG